CLRALPTIAAGQDLAFLEKALREAGYQLYNPPRANWGPGFVFRGDVVNSRIKNVEEICPNLYTDLGPPEGTAIVLPNFRAEDGFSFGLAIQFLRGLVGGRVDLGTIERERKAEVRWQNLQEMSYPRIVNWLESGEPRPIPSRCHLAIEDLKVRNQFKDRVFVIVRAVAPEVLVYDFSRAMRGDAGASVELPNQLKAEIRGKGELKNETQLEI